MIDEWLASNATITPLQVGTFHLGSRGMTGASVLLVGLEAAIKFSRHIPIIRSVR